MQSFHGGQRELLDVEALAGHLLVPGRVIAFCETPVAVVSVVDA
jgi:hypothetical protein